MLFVVPGVAAGNSMVFARRQAESLVAEGLAVEVFDLRSRTSPRVLWSEFLRFRRLVGTFRPQVIHAHYGTMTAMFAVLAAGKLPLMITYRGSDLNPLPSARRLRPAAGRLLSQLAALRASRIVCVSPQLRDRLWWRRARATVLPSGVDAEVFKPLPQGEMRRQLGWRQQDRIVLFNAGGEGRNKRLDLAQAATAQARCRVPALRLEVLDGNVPPERIPAMMNAADCLLVTSDAEGSPTVVQEALATNLPVVSVEAGDIALRLSGVANSRIAPRDAQALGSALAEMLTPPRRSDGRRRVPEFSSQRIARELGRLYRETVREPEKKRRPAESRDA
ncbi:MAG TPA: glycosyltransferase [Bryobacteraceae bacterium]|nr:glycosyltransferase [Bryobacteraceae bacterium]